MCEQTNYAEVFALLVIYCWDAARFHWRHCFRTFWVRQGRGVLGGARGFLCSHLWLGQILVCVRKVPRNMCKKIEYRCIHGVWHHSNMVLAPLLHACYVTQVTTLFPIGSRTRHDYPRPCNGSLVVRIGSHMQLPSFMKGFFSPLVCLKITKTYL
jgi:hypothetical protein